MSNDLVTGLEKWWKGLTAPAQNPLADIQENLDTLDKRLTDQEEKEAGTEKGETGKEGAEGKEGGGGSGEAGEAGEAGSEGQEGSNGEVGPEGTAEPYTQEIDSEGKVTNKVVTKKKLKEEIEKEGFTAGGTTDYRISIEIVKERENEPNVFTHYRFESIEVNAIGVGGFLKIKSITDKEGKAVVGKLNPDPFVGNVGYVGFAMAGGSDTIAWVMSLEGTFQIVVWTTEKHTIQVARSFEVNLIKLP